jgi:hypothetical protein
MRFILYIIFGLLLVTPVYGQNNKNLYKSENHRFLLSVPDGWVVIGELDDTIHLIPEDKMDDASAILSLYLIDDALRFDNAFDILNYKFPHITFNIDDFVVMPFGSYVGGYLVESNRLYATTIFTDDVVGVATLSEYQISSFDLRPSIVRDILTSVTYMPPLLPFEIDDLTETYIADNQVYSFHYPKDWNIEQQGDWRTSLIKKEGNRPSVFVNMSIAPISKAVSSIEDMLSERVRRIVLELTDEEIADESDIPLSMFYLNGRPVVQAGGDNLYSGVIMSLILNESYSATIISVGKSRYAEQLEAGTLTIASTLQIIEAQFEDISIDLSNLTQTYQDDESSIEFRHPPEWQVFKVGTKIAMINDMDLENDDTLVVILELINWDEGANKTDTIMSLANALDIDKPIEVQINEQLVARMDTNVGESLGVNQETYILLPISDSDYVLMQTIFAVDTRNNHISLIYSIASTVTSIK